MRVFLLLVFFAHLTRQHRPVRDVPDTTEMASAAVAQN